MSAPLPRTVRWILALAHRLTPAHRRAVWQRQWRAEVEHRRRTPGASTGLTRFALGALAHAFYLRRDAWSTSGLRGDVRHAARGLLKRPGFAALTVATLCLGIGSATAIFSLAEALVLRPLPLENDARLVRVYSTNATRGLGRFSVSWPDFADFAARTDLFESASLYTTEGRDVSGQGDAERIRTATVHEGFFQTLGSATRMGRVFAPAEHAADAEATVILAESFWARRYGSDRDILGRTIRLDGQPHTVVGVMPDRFGWPAGVHAWTPLQWGGSPPAYVTTRSNHSWQIVGLLRPGIGAEEASAQLEAMARVAYSAPGTDERDQGTEAVVVPLHSSESGDDAGAIFATLGAAVALVLLIACMNASALLMTRAWARSRELSLRSALGASRGRLASILMAESVLLATVGGALGVVLGVVGLDRAFRMAPPEITALGAVEINPAVVAAGVGISALAALVSGLLPAVKVTRTAPAQALRDGDGRTGSSRGGTLLRRSLVVLELAFSVALLVAAGLTVRSFQRQITSNPGFDAETLVSFSVRLPSEGYPDDASRRAYFSDALERLARHPGVVSATTTSTLPLGAGGLSLGRNFALDGDPSPPEFAGVPAAWVEVDPGYFATLDVRPVTGRAFTSDDGTDGAPVAMVNERMARLLDRERPIVGRQVRSVYDEKLPRTVVGVIPDLQYRGVSRTPRQPLVLVPRTQSVRASMTFLVRTSGNPTDMLAPVRTAMAELDPDVALDQLRTLRDAHAADLGGIRFLTTLFATFGVLALVLAVGGVYGMVATSVSQRTREIGVRMAVGATAGEVRRSVLLESAGLAAVGLTLGLGLAYGAGRVLAVGVAGVVAGEASTYAAVVGLLAAAVMAATWVPATRATRVDPVSALRSD